MHKLRRAARNQAWYVDQTGETTFNPFAKVRQPGYRRRRRSDDDEAVHGIDIAGGQLRRRPAWRIATQDLEEDNATESAAEQESPYWNFQRLKLIILRVWWTPLLPFVPAGFAVQYTNQPATIVFGINFVAIVPLSVLLSIASDELSARLEDAFDGLGDILGSLVNSAFSNAVMLVTSILLLKTNQIQILQTTLIGTILANMHLTLGLGFIAGGMKQKEQAYNVAVGQLFGTMLLLAMTSLIVPSVLTLLKTSVAPAGVLQLSRVIAIVLLLAYGVFLFFELKSHTYMFQNAAEDAVDGEQPSEVPEKEQKIQSLREHSRVGAFRPSPNRPNNVVNIHDSLRLHRDISRKAGVDKALVSMGAGLGALGFTTRMRDSVQPISKTANAERPLREVALRTGIVAALTTLLGFNTSFATDSLAGLIAYTQLTSTFIGIVLLPLLSVDFGTLALARNDEMDLFISLTVGKCLQSALLIIPIIVVLGWILGNESMSLQFDSFEVVALFASVMYINSIIQEGKSNYLLGVLLLGLFIIICAASYFVPTQPDGD